MEKPTSKNKETPTKKPVSLTPPKATSSKTVAAKKAPVKKEVKAEPKANNKSQDAFIQVKNITKYYINSTSEKVTALKDISFTLPSTGFVYLKGESGSGKSTLLNILGGLDSYDKGDMVVGGLSFKDLSFKDLDEWRAHHTAFVFQDFNLLSDFTVAENIRLGSNFAGMDVNDQQISDVLEKVGLKGFEKRSIGQLSGGERQRVSIARALVKTPRILLVDEPTGQINIENAENVFSILKDISKETLVVCVSYDPSVKKYVDREITLSKGEIIKDNEITRTNEEKVTVKDSGLRNITKKQNYMQGKPNQHIMKIGLRNVTGKRKWRTIALVLLTTFSLLFGSVLYMLSGYNKYEALAKNMQLEESSFMVFESDDPMEMYFTLGDKGLTPFLKTTAPSSLEISGVIEMLAPIKNQAGEYNAFGQKILHGAYPTYSEDEDDEITYRWVVITDYLASRIAKEDNSIYKENEFEDLIGKTIEFKHGRPQIIDLYFENFTPGGSLTIAGIIETDYKKLDKDSDKYKFNEQNIYTTIHAGPGFHASYAKLTSFNHLTIDDVDFDNVEFSAINSGFKINYDKTLKLTNGEDVTSVPNGEVLVSRPIFEAIHKTPGNQMYTFKSGGLEMEFGVRTIYNGGIWEGLLVIDTDELMVVFSEDDFKNHVAPLVIFPPTGVVLSTDNMDIGQLTELLKDFDKNYSARLVSVSSAEIYEFSEKMYLFKTAVLIFTIVAIVLTMALFYNFISLTILDNKKNIGVLRSLGASGGNIASIFIITIGLIVLACTIFTSILSIITAAIINSAVLNSMSIPFHIIIFDPALIGVIFFICVFIGVMATAAPIIRYSKQSPISQIKDNRVFRLKKSDVEKLAKN